MNVAIRAQYPARGQYDWKESLEKLNPVKDIELAFHSPDNFMRFVRIEDVLSPLAELGMSVPTIHMAHASLTNLGLFMPVLIGTLRMARAVNCHDIVLHPSRGKVKDLDMLVDRALIPILEDSDCNLLWETFRAKRRILTAWEQLAEFCERHDRNYICYDICHMQPGIAVEAIKDIDTYYHLIKGFHFSNWQQVPFKQHLPVAKGMLDFRKIMEYLTASGFEGNITLEYLPEFHDQLVPDALYLMKEIYQ